MARAAAAVTGAYGAVALAAGLLFVALWWQGRGRAGAGATVAQEVGAAAGAAVVEVAAGAVIGIGGAIGIPATNEDECTKALREGRRWDASFACPAGRFLGSIFE